MTRKTPGSFEVSQQEEGLRLDEVAAARLRISRSRAARLIREGAVLVDGHASKPAARLAGGSKVSARWEEPESEGPPSPSPLDIDVLFEDEHIAVVNKPPGLVVHPGAGEHGPTLVEGLLYRYNDLPELLGKDRPGVVHRLDRDTSGVLIVARTEEAQASISAQLKKRGVEKVYAAVAYGVPDPPEGRITARVARHPVNRKKMAVVKEGGRNAETIYKVAEDFRELSLLRLNLVTGRTHQIRVHLAHAGHPVAGDRVYGGKGRYKTIGNPDVRDALKGLSRQMLHARKVGFAHPKTGETLNISAPLPEDMAALVNLLKRSYP